MVFVPVPNVSMHLVNMRQYNQEIQNVFHVLHGDQPTAGAIAQANDIIGDWWIASLAPNISDTVTAVSIIGTDQTVQNGAQATLAFPTTAEGGVSTPPLPSGTTVAISWRTGFSGRSFRGRTFHVGLVEAQVDGNSLVENVRITLGLAYTQLIADLELAGLFLVVASRYANNAPRTTGIATIINTVLIDPAIDSQRRRLSGRGR